MSDILHGFTPTPPAPLTAHMAHLLIAGLRAEAQRAEAARARLPRDRRQRTELQAARYWQLTDQIAATRANIAELEAL